MLVMPDNPNASGVMTTCLSKNGTLLDSLLRAGDAAIVVLAAFGCYWVRFHTLEIAGSYVTPLLPTVLCVLLAFPFFGLYRSWCGQGVMMDVSRATTARVTHKLAWERP